MTTANKTLPVRNFGIICPACGHFVPMGKIEIEANAPLSKLRDALRERNWQGGIADCENQGCGYSMPAALEIAVFQGLLPR